MNRVLFVDGQAVFLEEVNRKPLICVGIDVFFDGAQYYLRHGAFLVPTEGRQTGTEAIAQWEAEAS